MLVNLVPVRTFFLTCRQTATILLWPTTARRWGHGGERERGREGDEGREGVCISVQAMVSVLTRVFINPIGLGFHLL